MTQEASDTGVEVWERQATGVAGDRKCEQQKRRVTRVAFHRGGKKEEASDRGGEPVFRAGRL